jgi:hypothetical protein
MTFEHSPMDRFTQIAAFDNLMYNTICDGYIHESNYVFGNTTRKVYSNIIVNISDHIIVAITRLEPKIPKRANLPKNTNLL